jgi:hypothetical protein
VGQIRVDRSSLRFRDESVRPPFEARVDDVSVSIENLSNARGATATIEAALQASPEAGSRSVAASASTPWPAPAPSRSTGSSPGLLPRTSGAG